MRWLSNPLVWMLAAITTAHADEPETIVTISPERHARAVSLDVRGVVPTPKEMKQISEAGGLTESILDSWLTSDAFAQHMVRHHKAILWNELVTSQLFSNRRLRTTAGIYYADRNARRYRGQTTFCGDFEADVDADGNVLSWNTTETDVRQEGWVWVTPYWAPDTEIRVCAWDAQTREETAEGIRCDEAAGALEVECGCGPELIHCVDNTRRNIIADALEQDLEHRLRDILERDAPYSELLNGQTIMINGPLSHFYRHIADLSGQISAPLPAEDIPVLDFADTETWMKVTVSDHYSGVLTSPGWLLRHQTNRGRANRFYGGFLCREFITPPDGIGGLEGGTPTPDLTLRGGCEACHARLEPWAAYWGRWQEGRGVYKDPVSYPEFDEACEACSLAGSSCPTYCRDDYMVYLTHPDEEPYAGWLMPFVFLGPDANDNPNIGPAGWVEDVIADGQLSQCATQNAARWLLGEEAPVSENELETWSDEFEDSGESYRSLFRTIVTSETYGRVK